MRVARWLELGCGLAAGVVGLAIIAFVLFGPIYQGAMCTTGSDGTVCTSSTAAMAQVNNGIPPLALLYFWTLAGVLLSVMVSTFLHWRFGGSGLRRFLVVTIILLIITAVAGIDLSIFMIPSILLALVAAFAAQSDGPVAAR